MATTASDPKRNIAKLSSAAEKALQSYEQKKASLLKKYAHILEQSSSGHHPLSEIELQKETSNLFRSRTPAKTKIDVRQFNKVLYVDTLNMVAEIEGMTTYEDIVHETLKSLTLPAVVPELKSITIGGALAGVGVESSSFRYGLVHETILEYEILLGDGRVVTVTPDNEHKDLYYAFPNSYGTLGYALKVKVRLIEAKPFVKLTHIHFQHCDDYFHWLEQACAKHRSKYSNVSYIEGVIFNKNDLHITLGEFVSESPFVSDYKYMKVYYKSIKKKRVDYVSVSDYIWRWDTDWFWCSKNFFMQNFLMRLIFGKFMLKSTVFWKIRNFFNNNKLAGRIATLIQGKVETVIQDIQVPANEAENFLNFFQKQIGIKPIWICPIKPLHQDVQYSFYKMDPKLLYINFGFWDVVPYKEREGYYNQKIEKKVEELHGLKSLYSDVYYSTQDFWNIYDKNLYLKLKKEYDPHHHLKDIYSKCKGRN
jgi:FAD/FMN-containing dehydrogenase